MGNIFYLLDKMRTLAQLILTITMWLAMHMEGIQAFAVPPNKTMVGAVNPYLGDRIPHPGDKPGDDCPCLPGYGRGDCCPCLPGYGRIDYPCLPGYGDY